MGKKSNYLRLILILITVIALAMGIITNWRAYSYRKACVAAKATVISVEVKPMSGKAVAAIDYLLTYQRDGATDTIDYSTTEAYSADVPLPAIEELRSTEIYIHYVPQSKKEKTAFADQITFSESGELAGSLQLGWFIFCLVLNILAYLFNPAIYRTKAS